MPNYDGSAIVCQEKGFGNTSEYSKGENGFCFEYLNKSTKHSDEYDGSNEKKKLKSEKYYQFKRQIY